MTPFTYSRATNSTAAIQDAAQAGAKYLGGGTNLVDLMRALFEIGGAEKTLAASDHRVDETYSTPFLNHNATELHAATVEWVS